MDVSKIRRDFPLLQRHPSLVYFDSACTTLKPACVIDAVNAYNAEYSGCAGRSAHRLAKKTSEEFDKARASVASFVGAKPSQVVWAYNATHALNTVAKSLGYSQKNKVVSTYMEHHSALLPLMQLKKQGVVDLAYAPAGEDGSLSADAFAQAIDKNTCLVVVHHTSNVTGASPPLDEITKMAHDAGALVLVDAAQGVLHSHIDFSKQGFDFMAFSGHKMLGPTGIGCLVGTPQALEQLSVFTIGGDTIERVGQDDYVMQPVPRRFEAGIQNYSGAIGMGAAAEYLRRIGMREVEEHEKQLSSLLLKTLQDQGAFVYGPRERSCALAAFNLPGKDPQDVALLSDQLKSVCLRAGVFCAENALRILGAPRGAVRASLCLYSTKDEIILFGELLKAISSL